MNPVPPRYLGVWQRRLLTTRDGQRDSRSTVFWLQTDYLHADLRQPAAPPTTPLAQCSAAQRAALAEQQGFAGLTRVEDDLCCWQRLLDFQPAPCADLGLMRFDGSERLIEDALDDSYREVWERLPDSVGPSFGQWLRTADGSARHACLLSAGDYFFFAAERPQPLRPGGHLRDRLAATAEPQQWPLLACELSFGRLRGAGRPWQITHSSLPGRAGQALLPAAAAPTPGELDDNDLRQLGGFPPAAGWLRCADPLPLARQEIA